MFRRIAVVAVLVGGGLAVTPTGASASSLCEGAIYQGVTTVAVGPECVPFPGAVICFGGTNQLGNFGDLWDQVCLPAN